MISVSQSRSRSSFRLRCFVMFLFPYPCFQLHLIYIYIYLCCRCLWISLRPSTRRTALRPRYLWFMFVARTAPTAAIVRRNKREGTGDNLTLASIAPRRITARTTSSSHRLIWCQRTTCHLGQTAIRRSLRQTVQNDVMFVSSRWPPLRPLLTSICRL